jgi:subtilase family serine protease
LDAKGVTVCVASGDQGAYGMHDPTGPKTRHADAPATCPHAVAVGGTSFYPLGLRNSWLYSLYRWLPVSNGSNGAKNVQESAWTYHGPQNGGATGGGVSQVFTARRIPDLSLNADPATGYACWFQGQATVVGGTSVACPVFAAALAVANGALAAAGRPALSGLAAGLSTLPPGVFQNVRGGNNSYNGVNGWPAGPCCTGRGSVNVTALARTVGG